MKKMTKSDELVYAGIRNDKEFQWLDWMDDYTYHENQKELIARYEIAQEIDADLVSWGMSNGLDLYNALTGRRFDYSRLTRISDSFLDELEEDFPQDKCLDHSVVFKNSRTGKIAVSSLVYVDSRNLITKSCDKWGFDVDFIPYDGANYHSMYVVYSLPEGATIREPKSEAEWRAEWIRRTEA